jgi:hypothetical protein
MNRWKISDFERGVREPDLLTLKAYADEASVSVGDLIDDSVRLPRNCRAPNPQAIKIERRGKEAGSVGGQQSTSVYDE